MPRTAAPRVFVEDVQGVLILSLADPDIIAEDVIVEVGEQLAESIDGRGEPDVLLSFRGVRHMSSAMLAVLMTFARRVSALGGGLKLCAIEPNLLEIFRITRFDRLLSIHAEESAALAAFASDPAPARR